MVDGEETRKEDRREEGKRKKKQYINVLFHLIKDVFNKIVLAMTSRV